MGGTCNTDKINRIEKERKAGGDSVKDRVVVKRVTG